MGPQLMDYLLYEPEDTGILWIKFNRPERESYTRTDKVSPPQAPYR